MLSEQVLSDWDLCWNNKRDRVHSQSTHGSSPRCRQTWSYQELFSRAWIATMNTKRDNQRNHMPGSHRFQELDSTEWLRNGWLFKRYVPEDQIGADLLHVFREEDLKELQGGCAQLSKTVRHSSEGNIDSKPLRTDNHSAQSEFSPCGSPWNPRRRRERSKTLKW